MLTDAPATAKQPKSDEVVAEFQTSRGSTYKQFKDGTTIRNRALSEGEDASLGGEQPRSMDTVFISEVDAREIGGLLQNPEMPVKFERMPSRKTSGADWFILRIMVGLRRALQSPAQALTYPSSPKVDWCH